MSFRKCRSDPLASNGRLPIRTSKTGKDFLQESCANPPFESSTSGSGTRTNAPQAICVLVEAELGCQRPQPLQYRIAEVVHLRLSDGTRPADDLVEHSEMCETSDTAAAEQLCSAFVVTLTKRFDVTEQFLREFLE